MVLPSNLSRKVAGEENTIEEFYTREIKRVEYFHHRFEIRDEESRKKKTDHDEEPEENKDVQKLLDIHIKIF